MPLEVIENITRVEADNRERKASAEAKAKQIVADAQRDGLALLQQTRAAAADRGGSCPSGGGKSCGQRRRDRARSPGGGGAPAP